MSDFLKASRASTRDLEIDVKINRIAEQATPKTKPEPPYPKFKKHANESEVRSSNYNADTAMRDMILDCEIEKIAMAAIPNKLGWKPSKIKSPVTQQMIDEAQAEAKLPISINGVNYRYRPSSLPFPIVKPIPPLQQSLTPAEMEAKEDEKRQVIGIIAQLNKDIPREIDNIKILDEEYSKNPENPNILNKIRQARLKELHQLYKIQLQELCKMYGLDEKGTVDLLKERILDHEYSRQGSEATYTQQKAVINKRIQDDYQNLMQYEADLRAIDTILGQNAQIMKDNEALIYATERENKEVMNAYADDLNALNQGAFSLAQLPGESDDDFRQRLVNTGQSTMTDDEIMDSANLQNLVTAKYNLKEILNNSGQIETIAKKLIPEERFVMNKQFPRVKKAFIDTYGQNNKTISDQEAVDFIRLVIQSAITVAPIQAPIQAPAQVPAPTPVNSPIKLKIDLHRLAEQHGIPLSSNDTVYDAIIKLDDAQVRIPDAILDEVHPTIIRRLEAEGRLMYYISTATLLSTPVKDKTGASAGASTTGLGIGTHNYPKLSHFGKVTISPDKLYYKNTLVIKSPHGKAITGLKNTRVSDAMVSILLKILEGGKVSKSELNLLSPHEKQLYDTLMVMSGGHKVHENSIDNSTREMKHRLELIGGEMDAGNNSTLLLQELHALLHRMAHIGLISTPAAAKFYRDMKSHYY